MMVSGSDLYNLMKPNFKGGCHIIAPDQGGHGQGYTDFIRTETLCQGGTLCSFRFVRHKTDAGEGWERSESI